MVSSDGRFWATVSVNRGSALQSDWYGVVVGKTKPSWLAVALRRDGTGVCTLQGPGGIAVSWKSSDQLVVTCTQCKQNDFFIREREWNGVSIQYEFLESNAAK